MGMHVRVRLCNVARMVTTQHPGFLSHILSPALEEGEPGMISHSRRCHRDDTSDSKVTIMLVSWGTRTGMQDRDDLVPPNPNLVDAELQKLSVSSQ